MYLVSFTEAQTVAFKSHKERTKNSSICKCYFYLNRTSNSAEVRTKQYIQQTFWKVKIIKAKEAYYHLQS